MSIHERGRSFEIVFRDGDGKRRWRRYKTKSEAKRMLAELETKARRVRSGLEVEPEKKRVAEAYEEYESSARGLRSFETLEGRFRLHILPALGDKLLHQVRPEDISAFLRAKLKDGLSPQTVRHLRVHLQRLFSWAKREARIFRGENPASLSWCPDLVEPEPKVLELHEVEAVIAACTTEGIRDFIRAAAYTGMRRGELIALKRADVDLKARLIHVRRSGDSNTTKGKKSRLVPIPLALLPHLERLLRDGRSEYVFPGEDGGMRPTDFDATTPFRTALSRAGIVEGYEHICVAHHARAAGERHGRAKLTTGQVEELKRLAKAGARVAELAQRFMVSMRLVRLIINGERWVGAQPATGGCGHSERHPDKAIRRCPRCDVAMWPKALPLRLSLKDLRSTYLTHVVEVTGSLSVAQELAGHASEATTRRHYAKVRGAHLLAQVDRVPFGPNKIPTNLNDESRAEANTTETSAAKTK